MTAIVFKAKAIQIYNHDDTEAFMIVNVPMTIKSSHIEDANNHRMFAGKVSSDIINIRAKQILKSFGIYDTINLSELPSNVTVTGNFMKTVRIEL